MKKLLSILICVVYGVTAAWAGGTITMNVSVSGPSGAGSAEVCGWDYNKVNGAWTKQPTTCGTTGILSYGENSWSLLGSFYQNAEADLNAKVLLPGYKFVNWTHTATNSIIATYTATDPEAAVDFGERSQRYSGTVNFTAHFDYMYSYLHKAKAVALAYQNIPVGMVSVDMGAKKDLNSVTQWSDPNETPNEYLYNEEGVTTKGISYTFNYYAKTINFSSVAGMESMKFVFDGWYADEEGTQLVSNENPYAHTVEANYDDPDGTIYDPSAKPLYAKFRFDAYYYYTGATAGFAYNGEKVGKITVTATVSDANTYDPTTSTYSASTTNEVIQDNNVYKVLPKSSVDYSYTYTLSEIPNDAKATFMGWSASPYGGTYLQYVPTHEYVGEYTTYSLDNTPEMASPTPPVYAVFLSYWYKDPTVLLTTSSQGLGKVVATYDATTPTIGWTTAQVGTGINQEKIENPDGFTYDVYYHAKNEHGAYFKGWAKVDNPNKLVADNNVNPYRETYTVTSTDKNSPFTPPTVYAVFESDIAILQQDKMICYQNIDGVTNINDAKVIINFNKATTLTARLKGEWANYFVISDKAQTEVGNEVVLNTSEGLVTLMVSYKKDKSLDQAIGKVAEIELSTNYGGHDVTRDLIIKVETVPVVTFLPTDGKGKYTIKHTDGSGIQYEMLRTEKENVDVLVTQASLSTIEMNIEDYGEDEYNFYGWQLTTSTGVDYISYTPKCTYTFSEPSIVRPVFTTSNVAVFTILGDPLETQYDDLQEAIDAAVAMGGKQVVVFSNNGNTAGTLKQGDYVIKPNVTLLIPGVGPDDDVTMPVESDEGKYVYRLKRDGVVNGTSIATEVALSTADYLPTQVTSSTAVSKSYRQLIVSDNTTITVESGANLYLYAILNRYQQTYDARPHRYGQMVLGENCQINVENGASLYAFGYITGAHSSRVIANSGAEVHEVFQYSDPRGGSGVAHLFLNRKKYKVFPFSQYYIQNIEIPLELQSGSVEYVTTTADVLNAYVVMTKFIIPNSGSGITSSTSGLFRLGNNASLIKYYDPITDRQKYILKGEGANPAQIRFGRIHIQMGDVSGAVGDMIGNDILGWLAGAMMSDLKNVQLNSKEYVLPLNNNMDVLLENVSVTMTSDFAFLAGSTLTMDEKSNMIVNAGSNVYIYDSDENRLPNSGENYGKGYGYFGNENYVLEQIVSTPNKSHLLSDGTTLKRQPKDVKDSKWIVNGKIIVSEGAGFYTTAGGAQIISTKNGQVEFKQSLANATTYQAKYVGGGATALLDEEGTHNKVAYTVNSSKLQNADATFTTTTSGGTYTYDPAQGKWLTGTNIVAIEGETIVVTKPGESVEGVVKSTIADAVSATIVANNGTATVSAPTYQDGKLCLSVEYTPSNVAGEYEGIITIKNNSSNTIATQRVALIEDYTPRFSTIEEYNSHAYIGYSTKVSPNIEPEANNVSGLLTGTYKSTWTVEFTGEHADEFSLEWGEDNDMLSDAQIVFKPKTVGNKNALMALTCSYKDGANVVHTTTVSIPLTATAATLAPNPLAFAEGIDSIFVGASATELFAQVANGNTKPIVITPSTSEYYTLYDYTLNGTNMSTTIKPNKVGTVTITADQEADLANGVAGTSISKTINITDNIVWNWENLYFGSENIYPISTLYNNWRLDIKENDLNVIRDFTSVNPGDYKVVLESWPDGEAQPVFTLTYNDGTGEKTHDFTSHVSRDPRHLSVYVNEARVYEAVTLNVSHINPIASNSGDDYYVQFHSTEDEIAQWTFYFKGIPDKLSFNASGNNNWQIEESANGTNWTIAYTWSSISSSTEFELSLQPSTNYVRISYGTSSTSSMGVLSKIAVTELLSVKADVEKLYMPIIKPYSQKNVVFTYVSESDLALKTNNNVFTTNPTTLTGSNQSPFYQIKRVAVKADNSTATTEIKDGMLSVSGSSAAVPIRTYTYPQELPIQLASDELERYYFVTSESYNTSWSNDEATRSIIMRNAVADASPYVVFHFADAPAPGVISFNYANISDGALWTVQESEDGTVWYDLEVDADNEKAGQVMRKFLRPEKSRYVRVIYNSDYAGTVDITNMAILPTTSVVVNPAQLTVFSGQPEELSVIASNLQDIQFTFTPSSAFSINQVKDKDGNVANNGIQYFQGPGSHNGKAVISYNASAAVTYGTLTITTNKDANGTPLANPEVLATVELTGIKRNLPNGPTGIMTGTGLKITNFKNANEGDEGYLREVNSMYAFDTNGKPLFDYVIIYGETKTTDGSGTVTAPSSVTGSNAQTPCYIYKKSGDQYVIEDETYLVENANSSRKSWRGAISIADTDLQLGNADPTPENLRVYITGFCPYASTGYTQSDEGVWYFEGDAGDKIDIYLEDCYIYSRYKSKRGNAFTRESGESYSGMVARGSGAVLLFANKTQKDGLTTSLDVTIHTRESNVLKSHYGCLFSSFVGRAFQISSPVHIYMQSENHYKNSYTTLTFDDKWPTDANDDTKYNRTNGFLSLQKQVNNAPSIDMGNKNTVVNFRGGHVELQNACISSDNYESSLAISYRTGVYGPSKFRFVLSYGIGTDGVEGTVNFYDGTTTVLPMEVPERFRQYYLMDDNGTTTSCLRTPKNTYVYGGSHCMMRACEAPTSKGGAPTDGISALGKFEYTYDMVWNANTAETEGSVDKGLVTPTSFPDACLTKYYENKYTYGLKSVTPVDGKLNLWIPDLDCSQFEVKPEVDQQISFWKASMTLIEANYGVYSGSVGGDNVEIAMQDGEQKEQVQNLLYCQIDDNISGVISAQGNDQYVAPVLNPAPDGGYISIAPTTVGTELQNYVRNTGSYVIEDKVYYVTTIPQADVWMNFTAPFNVANIYVVEAYDEDLLEQAGATRDEILVEQARHNANFAAFFGVAIALESKKTFNMIYNDYMGWVRHEYGSTAASKQGMKLLQHYYETYDAEGKYESSNWRDADYYLYKNTANWILDATGNFTTEWGYIPVNITQQNGTTLLEQGETYSMMFPYCTGCWEYNEEDDNYYRNDWDYWSGKFIIFESTKGPHTIHGSDYVAPAKPAKGEWVFDVTVPGNEAKLMGNSTFADMSTTNNKIYTYAAEPMYESYNPVRRTATVEPTATFLLSNFTASQMPTRISRTGQITYDNDGTTTGGNIPTVGGGNDLFITSTATGINIAVAEAQQVRVMSATGATLFSGMVQTAVDVFLPTAGVYVVAGDNEVHKILH